jgi:hypothetical protein
MSQSYLPLSRACCPGGWGLTLDCMFQDLITQQGGTLVFEGKQLVYEFKDKGILTYTDVNEILKAVGIRALRSGP